MAWPCLYWQNMICKICTDIHWLKHQIYHYIVNPLLILWQWKDFYKLCRIFFSHLQIYKKKNYSKILLIYLGPFLPFWYKFEFIIFSFRKVSKGVKTQPSNIKIICWKPNFYSDNQSSQTCTIIGLLEDNLQNLYQTKQPYVANQNSSLFVAKVQWHPEADMGNVYNLHWYILNSCWNHYSLLNRHDSYILADNFLFYNPRPFFNKCCQFNTRLLASSLIPHFPSYQLSFHSVQPVPVPHHVTGQYFHPQNTREIYSSYSIKKTSAAQFMVSCI